MGTKRNEKRQKRHLFTPKVTKKGKNVITSTETPEALTKWKLWAGNNTEQASFTLEKILHALEKIKERDEQICFGQVIQPQANEESVTYSP